MNEENPLSRIIAELTCNAEKVDQSQLEACCDLICKASRVFVAGAGRSGFASRAFTNRLMHLGFKVFFVGDTTTPSITGDDLLFIGSGSGATASLVNMAEKAKKIGSSIVTMTIFPNARIGVLADAVITVPGSTPKSETASGATSFQPMGNLFEQLSWLIYDALIIMLMYRLGITAEEMFARHANLE